LDLRQAKIQQLVTEYFRRRSDTVLESGSSGELFLSLRSAHALGQFGGKEQLRVTFDEELAFQNPDWALINATHPFLDVIRNDLASNEKEDPRLAEAYFPPQPMSPEGRVTIPGIQVDGPVVSLGCKTRYEPHFVLTYKVVFESDERQDYVLRLCFNARTGERRNDMVRHLRRLPLEEGRPPDVDGRGDLHDLEEIISRGRLEMELRVRAEVGATAKQHFDRLSKETERLKLHYEGEIARTNKRNDDGRRRLRENLKREIEEFEKKYAFRSRTYLTSVLLLWTPHLSYRLQASAKTANFFVEGITYDSGTDVVMFQTCDVCGNKQRFTICSAGRHAFCGDSSCKTRALCVTCNDPYCSTHGHGCANCSAPCCFQHLNSCAYDTHSQDLGFCPRCLKSSFERRMICVKCATMCELCGRTFPRNLIASCHIGKEVFCVHHDRQADGDYCSECGNAVCKKHGRNAENANWVCLIHSHEATCCARVFGDSELTTCIVDQAELLCEQHRVRCVVGSESTCEKHAVKSWQGEALCALHCDACIRCLDASLSRVYRTDRLKECVTCHGQVCADHLGRCEVCQVSDYCVSHQHEQPSCLSCSRISCGSNGCGAQSSTCSLCKMSYCRRCLTSKGICTTCAKPDPAGRASHAFPLLEALSAASDETLRTAGTTMLKSFAKCRVLSSENATYRVVSVHFKPSAWAFWQKEQKVRIVADHTGKVVKALIERTS
jgi:hypothetical protein